MVWFDPQYKVGQTEERLLKVPNALVLAAILGIGCATPATKLEGQTSLVVLRDVARGRDVPIQVTLSKHLGRCSSKQPCPVALISGGYGVPHTGYSFMARALVDLGYTVVSIQHDLPGDAPLARQGDLYALRMPVWERGVGNILFVRNVLARRCQVLDLDHLTLVGHSNGGDLSLVFAQKYPHLVSAVVTLDHRRVPIPRSALPPVLSVRASDTPPIPGVLPSTEEQATFGITIAQLSNARHNEMHDAGGEALKDQILKATIAFLAKSGRSRLHEAQREAAQPGVEPDGRCAPAG
jgi:pimeloyl-ACP methyl ester carboxylesterase